MTVNSIPDITIFQDEPYAVAQFEVVKRREFKKSQRRYIRLMEKEETTEADTGSLDYFTKPDSESTTQNQTQILTQNDAKTSHSHQIRTKIKTLSFFSHNQYRNHYLLQLTLVFLNILVCLVLSFIIEQTKPRPNSSKIPPDNFTTDSLRTPFFSLHNSTISNLEQKSLYYTQFTYGSSYYVDNLLYSESAVFSDDVILGGVYISRDTNKVQTLNLDIGGIGKDRGTTKEVAFASELDGIKIFCIDQDHIGSYTTSTYTPVIPAGLGLEGFIGSVIGSPDLSLDYYGFSCLANPHLNNIMCLPLGIIFIFIGDYVFFDTYNFENFHIIGANMAKNLAYLASNEEDGVYWSPIQCLDNNCVIDGTKNLIENSNLCQFYSSQGRDVILLTNVTAHYQIYDKNIVNKIPFTLYWRKDIINPSITYENEKGFKVEAINSVSVVFDGQFILTSMQLLYDGTQTVQALELAGIIGGLYSTDGHAFIDISFTKTDNALFFLAKEKVNDKYDFYFGRLFSSPDNIQMYKMNVDGYEGGEVRLDPEGDVFLFFSSTNNNGQTRTDSVRCTSYFCKDVFLTAWD